MASMPRLTLAGIRTMVRELTSIFSTDVITDARLNSMINQELFAVVKSADDMVLAWGVNGVRPQVVTSSTYDSVGYRFPAWRFDNTTQFPSTGANSTSNMVNYLYMTSDTDTAPWRGPSATADIGGYYDKYLAYKVASQILIEVNDDTKRNEYFDGLANDVYEDLFRNEWLNHNNVLADLTKDGTGSPFWGTSAYVRVMSLLFADKPKQTLDSLLSIANLIRDTHTNSKNELYSKYTWPFPNDFIYFAPYEDVFIYDTATKVGNALGLSELVLKGYAAEVDSRVQALLRDKLYSSYGEAFPYSLGSLRTQVRALLQDFSNDLPEQLIISWINEAYQTLSYEREWSWQEVEQLMDIPAGLQGAYYDLSGARRITGMYIVSDDVMNVWEASGTVEEITQRPDLLDGMKDSSKYYYDIKDGLFYITPTPEKNLRIKVKYITRTFALLADSDTPQFDAEFAPIIAYRAALKGLAFHDQGKKLYPIYDEAQKALHKAMVTHYSLDRSRNAFSMNSEALEQRKYMPYFRLGG